MINQLLTLRLKNVSKTELSFSVIGQGTEDSGLLFLARKKNHLVDISFRVEIVPVFDRGELSSKRWNIVQDPFLEFRLRYSIRWEGNHFRLHGGTSVGINCNLGRYNQSKDRLVPCVIIANDLSVE